MIGGMPYLDAGETVFAAPLAALGRTASAGSTGSNAGARDASCATCIARRWKATPGLRICLGAVAVRLDIDAGAGRPGRGRSRSRGHPGGEKSFAAAVVARLRRAGDDPSVLAARKPTSRRCSAARTARSAGITWGMSKAASPISCSPSHAVAGAVRCFMSSSAAVTRAAASRSATTAQQRLGLLNMAAWPDNPALADPAHRSAILSLALPRAGDPRARRFAGAAKRSAASI